MPSLLRSPSRAKLGLRWSSNHALTCDCGTENFDNSSLCQYNFHSCNSIIEAALEPDCSKLYVVLFRHIDSFPPKSPSLYLPRGLKGGASKASSGLDPSLALQYQYLYSTASSPAAFSPAISVGQPTSGRCNGKLQSDKVQLWRSSRFFA